MCGIIKTRNPKKVSMIDHRGLREGGCYNLAWVDPYYLGHYALPLQTIDQKVRQPISYKTSEGEFLLSYVGEIFNYPPYYLSDVEYITDVFKHRPLRDIFSHELNQWDGFWAIVLEDLSNGVTHAFTDPLGKKQLYYNLNGEICSEIKPLIEGSEFDNEYRNEVEKFSYNRNHKTPWSNVKQIIPGVVHKFIKEKLVESENYHFDWSSKPGMDLIELVLSSLDDRLRNPGCMTKGMLISGGLDSSILASLNEKFFKHDVRYYSLDNNESDYVDILANYLGLGCVRFAKPNEDNLRMDLVINESPVDLGSVSLQNYMMRKIKEYDPGLKVVITGDGADELFGGYKRNQIYDSQQSDIFDELTYYHLPRLDRSSMAQTIELRNPFLSHDVVRYALSLPWHERKGKNILKKTFGHILPKQILDRDKKALKNETLIDNPGEYKRKVIDTFYDLNWPK